MKLEQSQIYRLRDEMEKLLGHGEGSVLKEISQLYKDLGRVQDRLMRDIEPLIERQERDLRSELEEKKRELEAQLRKLAEKSKRSKRKILVRMEAEEKRRESQTEGQLGLFKQQVLAEIRREVTNLRKETTKALEEKCFNLDFKVEQL